MISGRLFEVRDSSARSQWTFVAGKSFIVAILAVEDVSALSSFDSLVSRADTRVEELVAAVPQSDSEGSFAIVAEITGTSDGEAAAVTVVVRGDTAVDVYSVGGWRRVTDRGIRPWLLADFPGTTAIVIGSTEAPTQDVDRLDRTELAAATRVFSASKLLWSVRGDEPEASSAFEPQASDAESRFAPGEPRTPATDDTVLIPRLKAAGAWTPPPIPNAPLERAPTGEVYRFRVGGQEILLTETAFVGRNPQQPRIRTSDTVRLVTVASATREVSSTHLKIEQVGSTVVVTDLASANGTIVTAPGAAPVRLRGGESLVVGPGTRLDIGDGNIVEILTIVSAPASHTAEPSA
ncbi:FHA domain-containing protein [Homoserinimonas sp. OAct 916]|uniref:FHA domain-containing protein n=1 Tax=Homoserinimonas sp. OAct 916 TaxID=2211450 RepID=UPI001E45D31C|nr:FHA domain-containing protein [Homoserinimonas sp. OAct 916]